MQGRERGDRRALLSIIGVHTPRIPLTPRARAREPNPVNPDDILKVADVAELLGVDRKTVYAAVRRREIPYKRLGRKLLFSQSALLEWWTSQGRVVSERK